MEKGKEGKSAVGEHVALNTLWWLGYLFLLVYVHHVYMDLFAAFSLALSAVGALVHSHGDMLRLFRLCGVVLCSNYGCGRCSVKDAVRFTVPKPFS